MQGRSAVEKMPLYAWYGEHTDPNTAIIAYHTHTAHELLFVLEGQVEMHIAGCSYRIGPGEMVVINAVEMHDLTPLSYPYRRIGVHITSEALPEIVGNTSLSTVLTNHGEGFCPLFRFQDGGKEMEGLMREIHKEYTLDLPYREELLRRRFFEVLVLLYRTAPEAFSTARPDPVIGEICRYIDGHFAEELSVEALAKMHFFSTQYFIRRFRGAVGYSPKQYLILRRLSEARVLLSTTDLTVSAIAAKTGFADANGFVRCFRKYCGLTPGAYRRQYATPKA